MSGDPGTRSKRKRTFNLADLWEAMVEAGPDDECLVAGSVRHNRASLERRANRIAHQLQSLGVGHGQRVAIHSRNRAEYVETLLGCWKLGAVAVNVNWRYSAPELHQVLADSGAVGAVVERGCLPALDTAAERLDTLSWALVLEDGSDATATHLATERFEEALAPHDDEPPGDMERSQDDHYLLYTGGTTGLPRGVVWRHEDFFRACVLSGDPTGTAPVEDPDDMARHATTRSIRMLVLAPLMHGGGQWPTLIALYAGGTAIVSCDRSFDPGHVLDLIEEERPLSVGIVGDAMARPLAEAALDGSGRSRDLSSLASLGNGGAMLSAAVKEQLRHAFPQAVVTDSFGASETGASGRELVEDTSRSRPAFGPEADTAVLDPLTLRRLDAGSDAVGLLARRGHIPLGYWNDPAKTEATFRTDPEGVRWVLPGDEAMVDADGRVVLLGRGSGCINSGGEKVFPEEVEAALRAHPAVVDAVVVGVPDERWGQAVVAALAVRRGHGVPTLTEVRDHCRARLAGYKVPRRLLVVDGTALRTNTGKPDYSGVRALVAAEPGGPDGSS